MNRKGASILVDLFIYFLFVIVVVIFWGIALFIQNEIDEKVSKQAQHDRTKTDLLLYLRQMTAYDYRHYTITDFIIEAQYDPKKQEFLEESLTWDFDYNYDDFWSIIIQYPDDEDNKIEAGHKYTSQKIGAWTVAILDTLIDKDPVILPQKENITITTTLPSMGGENIEIKFSHWLIFVI